MNQYKLLRKSLIITLLFFIIFPMYLRVKNNTTDYIMSETLITGLLFFMWIVGTKLGTHYITIYNSQIL